jgi:hypothetical protein
VVAAVVLVAVAVNLVQFAGIERDSPANVGAIHQPGTHDLRELMYHGCAVRCLQRYGVSIALGLIAPGSRVVVPDSGPLTADRNLAEELFVELRAFGGVERIDVVGGDVTARILGAVDPTPHILASGAGGTYGDPWAIAVDPARGPASRGDPPDFIRRSLQAGVRPDRTAPAREFVMVRWNAVDLVLETSLLPADLAAELRS